jgi:hypothetical protein
LAAVVVVRAAGLLLRLLGTQQLLKWGCVGSNRGLLLLFNLLGPSVCNR